MNRLALGTVQFGQSYGIANKNGQVPKADVKSILRLAFEKGIDTLDTAISYGVSESCLGEAGTEGFRLVSKLPPVPTHCSDKASWIIQQIKASLCRLGVDSLYGLLLHSADQLLESDGEMIFQVLQGLKHSGLVKHVGVSIYAASELDLLIPRYRFDLVQAPFNIIDRRLLTSGWLKRLKQEGIIIHTRSAFLQGLLLMPQEELPTRFTEWSALWEAWHAWLLQHDVSAVEACLSFPLSFSEIDRVIVGVDSVCQLEEIIIAASSLRNYNLPDLYCQDESLINPSRWHLL